MSSELLPPGPELRTWNGSSIRVSTFYSVAGVSTSMFLDMPIGRIIMEAGDGCTRDLIELQRSLPNEEIDTKKQVEALLAIVISHPHYDHYSGLLNLLNFLHLMQRYRPIKIIYPKGSSPIEGLVDHFLSTLWEKCPFDIELIPVEDETEMRVDGWFFRSVPVMHRFSRPGAVGGKVPAMAYSISYGEERVVYSGDTSEVRSLEPFFKGADLGIVETTFARTPEGHEEVHLDINGSCALGSNSLEHWHVHFTGPSFKKIREICQ